MNNSDLSISHDLKSIRFRKHYPTHMGKDGKMNTISFLIGEIPNQEMLYEAIHRPSLDWSFASAILLNTRTELSAKLEKIIENQNNLDNLKLWKEISKELAPTYKGDHRYNPKLYAYFSLENHRTLSQPYDSDSIQIFKSWSNLVLASISNISEDSFIKDFCDSQHAANDIDFSYDEYKYHTSVWYYCTAILPRPLQYLSTLTSEINWLEDCIKRIDTPKAKPLFENIVEEAKKRDSQQRQERISLSYPKEQRESLIRTEIRFSQFAESFEYLKLFDVKYGEEMRSYRESRRREQFNLLTQAATERKQEIRKPEKKRSKLIENGRLRLHQCVFCWRYRLGNSPEKDESKWHCGRKECRNAFGSWRKDLNSNNITLEDLGRREGF